MGASPSPEEWKNAQRRALRKVRNELKARGIVSSITGTALYGTIRGADWRLSFRTLRASNGEMAGLPEIHVNGTQQPDRGGLLVDRVTRAVSDWEEENGVHHANRD